MSNTTPRTRLVAVAAAITLLVAAVPGIAMAQTTDPAPTRQQTTEGGRALGLDVARTRVLHQIDRRLNALQRLDGDIYGSPHVTDADAVALQADIAAATATLTNGIPQVEAAGSIEELRAMAEPLFQDTLVFALISPKTHEVLASDATVAVGDRFTEVAADLQDAIDRMSADGADMSEAKDALDELLRLVDDAVTSGGPVAGTVVGLEAGNWPDPAHGLLQDGRFALGDARLSLRKARSQAHEVIRLIHQQDDTSS